MTRLSRLSRSLFRLVFRYRYILLTLILSPPLLLIPLVHSSANSPTLVPKSWREASRPLLAVAHPDDECLFFAPAVLSFGRRRNVKPAILVLSTGNNYGIGSLREQELQGSCRELGVALEDCVVLNVPGLEDNPREWWPTELVADVIKKHVEKIGADLIYTFDEGGVSGHLNHRSVHRGIEHLVRTTPIINASLPSASSPDTSLSTRPLPSAFASTSVSLLRKFSTIFDLTLTSLPFLARSLLDLSSPLVKNDVLRRDDRGLFLTSWSEYIAGRRAFASHASQVSWDRYLYLLLSRYMILNDVSRIQ
ncbi:putative deacetylase LmbE-like domain-containing protein [Phlyctochytrium arcticum]|nr:putative deacetylase LmbE-like domain-containing protein [Phlyctochytrium arcticum]